MPASFIPSRRAQWAAGQPISELMSRTLGNPQLISLAAGFVDTKNLPTEIARQAIEAVFVDDRSAKSAMQYGTNLGEPRLREQLLARVNAIDFANRLQPTIEQVLITSGSNQALHLIADTLLDEGDIVLCASPTYLVMLGIIQNVGARAISVATDRDGIVVEALEETLRSLDHQNELERVKAIYLVPYFDNPAGINMPADRRAAIVEMAKRWSHRQPLQIISDEAYRELRFDVDDIPSLCAYDEDGTTVLATGTFSKSFSPGIRVGWSIVPQHLLKPLCGQKGNVDFGSPNFDQQIVSKVLELDLLDLHINQIRQSYRARRDSMLQAAKEFLGPCDDVTWTQPEGGLYVWATLPRTIDSGPSGVLFDAAIRQGMFYVPGEYFSAAEGSAVVKNTMRLSYGDESEDRIRAGIASLGRAINEVAPHFT